MHTFYEFFAGGGMARIGLGDGWECLFANDVSPKKAAVYKSNFGDAANVLRVVDVAKLQSSDLPGKADLVWGSFPCQDLSLAGNGAGLQGDRSGVFWPFWKLIRELQEDGRGPDVVVLENVQGALTSHKGADFNAIVEAVVNADYRVGALTVDAAYFIPQSRPRLFFVAIKNGVAIAPALLYGPDRPRTPAERIWHSDRLISAHQLLPERLKKAWLWWRMKAPDRLEATLDDLLEPDDAIPWHAEKTTGQLLAMMSEIHLQKVERARHLGRRLTGTIYKRTRLGKQRAEVRFDGISGCLRTPEGGSSRQTVLQVSGSQVRSRLLTTREAARLMGLPDSYILPANYNDAYHISGDGLVVPVVAWMERQLLRPLLEGDELCRPLQHVPQIDSGLFTHV